MPRYMLDTDTCSYIMRTSNAAIRRRLQRLPTQDVCMSVITKCELLYGVELSAHTATNRAAADAFFRHVAVADFPDQAAAHYAQIRADLKTRGAMIGANDLLIAAHARCLDLILVTNNVKEFKRVKWLKTENWVE